MENTFTISGKDEEALHEVIAQAKAYINGETRTKQMKLVVTVVGKDRVGIIATVSSVLAENNVNIISINQNIMNGFFNMVLIAEMNDKDIKLQDLQKVLKSF